MTRKELAAWMHVAPSHHREACLFAADAAETMLLANNVSYTDLDVRAARECALELQAICCGALGFVEALRARRRESPRENSSSFGVRFVLCLHAKGLAASRSRRAE